MGPPSDHPSWIELDRADVADGLVETIAEGVQLRAELYAVAEQLGEHRPDAAWRQARNVARRCEVRLAAVVAEFALAADRTRCDVSARVRAELRRPVACPAAFAWGITRRSFGLGHGRTKAAGRGVPRSAAGEWPAAVGDQVADELVLVAEVSGCLPLYVPEPEPERRLSAEEMQAIRTRAEARRSGVAAPHEVVLGGVGGVSTGVVSDLSGCQVPVALDTPDTTAGAAGGPVEQRAGGVDGVDDAAVVSGIGVLPAPPGHEADVSEIAAAPARTFAALLEKVRAGRRGGLGPGTE